MKRINYVVAINGRDFKARHDNYIKVNDMKEYSKSLQGAMFLHDVYGHYSDSKQYAYNGWWRWYSDHAVVGISKFRISSHNCNFFSLEMLVKDENTNEWWLCTATGRNNYAVKVITE